MFRRTKIVTTLGPATDKADNLKALLQAGANVVRLNFSHGSADDHLERAEQVRQLASELGVQVAILGDLQGPKIRISTFADGPIQLKVGDRFTLDSALAAGAGNKKAVGLDYKTLPQDLEPGDRLLLDDGRVHLDVEAIEDTRVITRVSLGGQLSNNKGINKLGGGLSAAALTDKDRTDILTAAKIGVDYLAVSFPRSSDDIELARRLASEAGFEPSIVAKVERAETVETEMAMDEIILASDAVMVARGDLGVEIGDPELVGVQKRLIRRARQLNRVVITATQMMESMIHNPMPTRAEVMDIANAVLDGTDAVMLSGETAMGAYPVETVKTMAEICQGAEKHPSVNVSKHRLDKTFTDITETVAMATMYAANHLEGVKAIIALTESGKTPLLLSRISSGLPIFALSRDTDTLNRVSLYRGVRPVRFDFWASDIAVVADKALEQLKQQHDLNSGDIVLVTHGGNYAPQSGTNSCNVLTVR
ncbi:pyruvate kinase [Motiliproteus coralliicola]|uniref:Pyruvate kinase n=1 Tax=Motiliproteus coralliicola TaxID=2283196 RepID=A0A369WFG1_9GAMM|nr:pyruvate kinase [Motiliproteus coralliicola]RDE19909.1 pyruvate kinase [Motiliproteus coralliicola]